MYTARNLFYILNNNYNEIEPNYCYDELKTEYFHRYKNSREFHGPFISGKHDYTHYRFFWM